MDVGSKGSGGPRGGNRLVMGTGEIRRTACSEVHQWGLPFCFRPQGFMRNQKRGSQEYAAKYLFLSKHLTQENENSMYLTLISELNYYYNW